MMIKTNKQAINLTLMIGMGSLMSSSAALAVPLTLVLSNTFVSGQPATAEAVNQNFSDVKTVVDTLSTTVNSWVGVPGPEGAQGVQGIQGPAGADGAPASQPSTAYVDFSTCFDLEGGVVADDGMGSCTLTGDIRFAFNSTRSNPAILFWNEQYADLAMLKGVPFGAVDATVLSDNLLFSVYLGDPAYPYSLDVPFNATDTAIVLTGDGNYYKVGYAICEMYSGSISTYTDCMPMVNAGAFGVRFKYEIITP